MDKYTQKKAMAKTNPDDPRRVRVTIALPEVSVVDVRNNAIDLEYESSPIPVDGPWITAELRDTLLAGGLDDWDIERALDNFSEECALAHIRKGIRFTIPRLAQKQAS